MAPSGRRRAKIISAFEARFCVLTSIVRELVEPVEGPRPRGKLRRIHVTTFSGTFGTGLDPPLRVRHGLLVRDRSRGLRRRAQRRCVDGPLPQARVSPQPGGRAGVAPAGSRQSRRP